MTGYKSKKAAALDKLAQKSCGCANCGKKDEDGWALYCVACIDKIKAALAQLAQEPEYWNVIDPSGNVVASETDAIRGWARIAGSYKPTVEGLLGLHEQGWRVLPKVAPPLPPQRPWVDLTDEQIADYLGDEYHDMTESDLRFFRLGESAAKEKNG